MPRVILQAILVASLGLVAQGAAGCGGSSPFMVESFSEAPITALTDKATVVFLRPSSADPDSNFFILNQKGMWVGDAVADTYFAVSVPPGENMFIGVGENTASLKVTLVAGRVYYVKVEPRPGVVSDRLSLLAVTKRHPEWSQLDAWLKGSQRVQVVSRGQTQIDGMKYAIPMRVLAAIENWEGYSDAEKERRTIRADDGVP